MVRSLTSCILLLLLCITASTTLADTNNSTANNNNNNKVCGVPISADAISCPILSVLPFDEVAKADEKSGLEKPPQTPPSVPFGHMATILMAVQHFNERNPYIVKELADSFYSDTCKVELPLYCDTLSSIVAAVKSDDAIKRTRKALSNLESLASVNESDLCGVIGPYSYKTLDGTTAMANSYQTAVVSYHPTDLQIGRNHLKATTTSVTADVDQKAYYMLDYIMNHLNRNYVVLIYHAEVMNFVREGFVTALKKHNDKRQEQNLSPFEMEFYSHSPTAKDVNSIVNSILDSKWKTIIGAFPQVQGWDRFYEQMSSTKFNQGDNINNNAFRPGNNDYLWYSFDVTDVDTWIRSGQKKSTMDSSEFTTGFERSHRIVRTKGRVLERSSYQSCSFVKRCRILSCVEWIRRRFGQD